MNWFSEIFKNASAFLLRDARHAKHDIVLLRISAILPEAFAFYLLYALIPQQ